MPIDATIPLGIQQPNGMQTLSSLIGMKTAIQGQQIQQQEMQANAMANEQNAIDLTETKNAQGLLKNIKNYQDGQGNLDFNRLAPDLAQAAPKNFAKFMAPLLQVQQAHTQAQESVNTLDAQSRGQVGQILYSLKGQKPEVIANTLDQLSKAYPTLTPAVGFFQKQILAPAINGGSQKALDDALDGAGKMINPTPTQQDMATPGGVAVSNGQTSSVMSTKPGTYAPTGEPIPGTAQKQQLPPTTPTISQEGQPGYLGSQPQADFSGLRGRGRATALADIAASNPDPINRQEAANALTGRAQGFIPSAMAPGQAENISNNFAEMNRHFAGLQDQATGTQLIQGLTGNIKALAAKAITGTGSDKLAYANGLIATFLPGEHKVDDLKTATDLLDKNVSQLALGTPGGSTDAARALISAARPNSHMTPEAISDAADQVASQAKASMVIRNMLAPAKQMGDVETYNRQRQVLENVADPRAFQFESANAEQRVKMLKALTPDDRQALRAKIQKLIEMGLLK